MTRLIIAILILILTTTNAKKKIRDDYDESDYYKDESIVDGKTLYEDYWSELFDDGLMYNFDLRGTLRKRFVMDLALEKPNESFVCSPVTALLPLGKLALAAKGKTEQQLLEVVGSIKQLLMKLQFRFLVTFLNSMPDINLKILSKIYISNNAKLNSTFKSESKRIFRSSVNSIDFTEPGEAADIINNWVRSKTKNKIPSIISEDDISDTTSIILVNAVYFAGKWQHPFTKVEPNNFYTPNGVKRVPMMYREGFYEYVNYTGLDAEIVEIPYNENLETTFLILLPHSKNGLSDLLEKIRSNPDVINEATMSLKRDTDIRLTIPSFKISTEIDLKKSLKKLGVTEIFSSNADLSGMVEDENVFVSKAIQRAVIEVNEFGTEAAAASAVHVELLSSKIGQVEFNANRPFLYYIKIGIQVVFAGIYTGQ